ncbi:MAG TPA: hypothetical protein VFU71_06100 [Burkholderiaceae bacterium]|nr:hypothetical protein [Burkholderiaceae bacterium]
MEFTVVHADPSCADDNDGTLIAFAILDGRPPAGLEQNRATQIPHSGN